MSQNRHVAGEFDELKEQLLTMGALAEERLTGALRGLVERDNFLLSAVVSGDSRIDALQIEVDHRCFTILALQQPVAVDLRTVVSALRINDDLERVGDLAVEIADAAQSYQRHAPVKPLIDIPRMGQLARSMLHDALEAFVNRDVVLARHVLEQDDWVDALREQIFRELLTFMLGDPRTIEPSVELMLIASQLERVADHATNIAEDVVFVVEGRDIRHRSSGYAAPGRDPRPTPQVERRRATTTPPV
jgi:phosphate transport system protein